MGLLEDFAGQFLDWKTRTRKTIERNARDPSGLLSSFAGDVQQGAAADKSAWDASRSVMPGVREAGIREMNARGQELGGLLGAIKAYHGSPHKFDRFDLSKIGTGEGAQAYGHGIYMAESPGVAGSYRDKLSKNEVLLDGKKVKHNRSDTSPQSMGLNALQMEPTPAAASAALRNAAADDTLWQRGSQYYDLRNNYLAAADWLDANAKRLQVDSGSLYEASIRWPDAAREAADPLGPQHFLDWDKPLSEQPDKVRAIAAKRLEELRAMGGGSYIPNDPSGEWIHKAFGPQGAESATSGYGQTGSSTRMRNAGIPGIRYLDGGSRGAGQGTHNYVVFDDKLLEILKRNGEPVPQQGLLAREPTGPAMSVAPSKFDFANPGGGSRVAKIGNTEITYGVGKNGIVDVILVKTPKAKRGEGSARNAMEQLAREADANNLRLALNAEPMDKGVTQGGLEAFYKSLGFRKNTGRKADFDTTSGWVRDPQQRTLQQEPQGLLAREPTQFELAHAEAQRNAALPVEQGGLGLGPQNTAMERAKAMGFDTPAYHGTGKDWTEFDNEKVVRNAYGKGMHAAASPKQANIFAGQATETQQVMPLMLNRGKTASADDYKRVMNAVWNDLGHHDATEISKRLQAMGYDSVTYPHGTFHYPENGKLVQSQQGEDLSYAILKPENIRSRFAAFDPKKKNSRDLLASMGLLGLLGAGAYGQEQ